MASRDARGAAAGTGMAAGAVTRNGNAETAGGIGGGSDRGVAASTSAAVSGTPTKSAAARPAPGQRVVCGGGAAWVEPDMTPGAQGGQMPSENFTRRPPPQPTPTKRGQPG